MKPTTPVLALLLLGLGLALAQGPSARGDFDDPDPEAVSVADTWDPSFELDLKQYRSFAYDRDGGLRFKVKNVRLGPEQDKVRALRFSAKRDAAFGFFNAGLRMGNEWTVRATYAFPSDKGLVAGQSFGGIEVDFPRVSIGTVPTHFAFAGVTYQNDGLSTFATEDGTNVGTPRSYPGATAIDLEIRYRAGVEYRISSRATRGATWDTIWEGDPGASHDMPVGLGFGLANVDKKAKVYVTDLCARGVLFDLEKQGLLNDLQTAIQLEQAALAASELTEKYTNLSQAAGLIEDLADDVDEAYDDGAADIDIRAFDKLVKKILKQDDKVLDKVDPDRGIQEFGDKERERIEKAIRKKRQLAEVIQAGRFELRL